MFKGIVFRDSTTGNYKMNMSISVKFSTESMYNRENSRSNFMFYLEIV